MTASPQPRDLAIPVGCRRQAGFEVARDAAERGGEQHEVGGHRLELSGQNIRGGSVRQ